MVRAQYEEQLGWAAEEGVDFVIAETNDYVGEALIALEVCQELGLPAMVTFASVQAATTYDGYDYVEACRILADEGAAVVGLNCSRGPGDDAAAARADPRRGRRPGRRAAGPVPDVAGDAGVRVAARRTAGTCSRSSSSRSSARASRWRSSRAAPRDIGVGYIGICCGGAPHHVRAMAEALGRETPASRYSPAIELHPVLGTPREETAAMDALEHGLTRR